MTYHAWSAPYLELVRNRPVVKSEHVIATPALAQWHTVIGSTAEHKQKITDAALDAWVCARKTAAIEADAPLFFGVFGTNLEDLLKTRSTPIDDAPLPYANRNEAIRALRHEAHQQLQNDLDVTRGCLVLWYDKKTQTLFTEMVFSQHAYRADLLNELHETLVRVKQRRQE